jgi:hypothetical protein
VGGARALACDVGGGADRSHRHADGRAPPQRAQRAAKGVGDVAELEEHEMSAPASPHAQRPVHARGDPIGPDAAIAPWQRLGVAVPAPWAPNAHSTRAHAARHDPHGEGAPVGPWQPRLHGGSGPHSASPHAALAASPTHSGSGREGDGRRFGPAVHASVGVAGSPDVHRTRTQGSAPLDGASRGDPGGDGGGLRGGGRDDADGEGFLVWTDGLDWPTRMTAAEAAAAVAQREAHQPLVAVLPHKTMPEGGMWNRRTYKGKLFDAYEHRQ